MSTINQQTPGPVVTYRLSRDSDPDEREILVTGDFEDEITGIISKSVDARLLAAAYNAFDKAGRELGVDAAELAEKVDLVGTLKFLWTIKDIELSDEVYLRNLRQRATQLNLLGS
jgi:hypothetical protein